MRAQIPGLRVAAVISNKADAAGLAFAAERGIATAVVAHRDFASRDAFDAALRQAIDGFAPDAVILAGFMRVLGEDFVTHYHGRLINIHPSLLPTFAGLHTHRRALAEGVRVHGATVHFVTPTLDSGPIIVQAAVPVLADDDEDRLAARVLVQEHRIFPQALRWWAADRMRLGDDGRVQVDADVLATATLSVPPLDDQI